ncbi:MAG: Hsp20/alpha crystallin family protein [Thermodesulfobacteriota bacterium]
MDFKKLAPWNWFKTEEEENEGIIPIRRGASQLRQPNEEAIRHPLKELHQEMDRLFDDMLRGFAPFFPTPLSAATLIKPQVDIRATEKEYTVSAEIPGVDEKDISIEVNNSTLTIRGEKRQDKEEKETNYYRIERSYGAFQRILSLPGDGDTDAIRAHFKNGVLTITIPRKAQEKSAVRQIEIHDA